MVAKCYYNQHKKGEMAMEYYVGNKKIFVDDKIFAEGEESTLHECGNNLAKILKTDRRKDIKEADEEMYEYLSHIHTNRFILPINLLHNKEGIFKGAVIEKFMNPEIITHAQLEKIDTIISELQYIEEDVHILTDSGIAIKDMKLAHILYSSITHRLGVIDFGLFEKSNNKQLLLDNLKEINYYLRQGLLWADLEGTKNEMLGIDFPEVYDALDSEEAYLSEILKEESAKYGVFTLQELKHVYQKMKFY